MLSMLFLKYSC